MLSVKEICVNNIAAYTCKIVILSLLFVLSVCNLKAVPIVITDGATNSAFKNGETAQYDLYYNWKFMWVKAGTGTISTISSYYKGQPAYRVRILTRGSSQADKFFVLRDTLTSYMSTNLLPLFYTKTDLEGEKYRVRKVWFNYEKEQTVIKQQYINPYGAVSWKTEKSSNTVYDMASLLMRARAIDASQLKPGHTIKFQMTDGNGLEDYSLVYKGKENVKTKNGSGTYRCLKVAFNEKTTGKEVGTFYVTDDDNHLPVACFLNISFGSARIYLSGYKNLRNPMTAKIK